MNIEIHSPVRTGFLLATGAVLASALILTALDFFGWITWNTSHPGDDDSEGGLPSFLLLLILTALSIAVVRSKPSSTASTMGESE